MVLYRQMSNIELDSRSLSSAGVGLPRLVLSIPLTAEWPNKPGRTSEAGRALANHASVASGVSASSSSGLGLRGMARSFLVGNAR